VPRWRDIRDVTRERFIFRTGLRTVNVISGGDPCQPHSLANRNRKGEKDERFLWPEYLRIVKELRPNWVLNENVVGSISNGIVSKKINDLEQESYYSVVLSILAFAVGAWHFRQRVIIIANSDSKRLQRWEKPRNVTESRENRKKQFEGLYSSYTCNSNSKSESQENKMFNPIRGKWNTWKDITRKLGGTLPRNYWTLSEPPIPGVDAGIPNRMDRVKALGNCVVPQQIYPILKAIADIENNITL